MAASRHSMSHRTGFEPDGEEARLQRALVAGLVSCHYQPIVRLDTRRVVAVEALVRPQAADMATTSAAELIDTAEKSGQIDHVFSAVLADACALITRFDDLVPQVLINISAIQLGTGVVTEALRQVLDVSGVDNGRIGLEVTEKHPVDPAGAAGQELAGLVSAGYEIIADDFGSGYITPDALASLPFTGVKLDRSFTSRLESEDDAMGYASVLLEVANERSMFAVVEGIETEEQARIVQALGWEYGQGYHFARPMPATDLVEMLAA